MGWKIMYDPELHIAALIDPDAPAALGPIAVDYDGDSDPVGVLSAFAEQLGEDPSTLPTYPLLYNWFEYVRAWTDMADKLAADADAAEAAGAAADGDPADQEGDPSAVMSDRAETAELGPDGPELPAVPAAESIPDPVPDCWLCTGSGKLTGPSGQIDCYACQGTGKATPV